MKNDEIEKFIYQNRDAFDSEEPPAELWERIQQKMKANNSPRVVRFYSFRRVAAAIIMMLLGSLATWLVYENDELRKHIASVKTFTRQKAPDLAQIVPELAEAEAFYTQQIQLKALELSRQDWAALSMEKDYEIELNRLAAAYEELKADLYQTGSEQVIGAMIQNLQYRMELLNQQLQIIKKLQQQKWQKHDKVS
ncbi:MAG: hypothetical protein RMJ87_08815 [Cytophagales bacterium]|nr:hypothetical protein [Bernardetiaceae bacterium]MDW8205114.1 hypothetical protein [Cytophagales bacterium]